MSGTKKSSSLPKSKKKLYIFTLEIIEQRYTRQWYSYFKKEFGKHFDVEYIDGTHTTDKIDSGKFLDINKTNIWKAEQVIKVSNLFIEKKIKDGDRFFFADAWHFGITALKYMAQLNGINIKMYGYWHAGTYDPHDFITQAGLWKWADCNEAGWFNALDGSFVATNYHKDLILQTFKHIINPDKIKVVGFPMDWDAEIKKATRKIGQPGRNLIVFPHRVDPEKSPEVFDKLAKQLPKYEFIKTIEVTKTKEEYYNMVKDAKVTFSANKQETFGIGTVEAMFLGAIPLVPYGLAYDELYDDMFKYSNLRVAKSKIEYFCRNYNNPQIKEKLKNNIQKIKRQSLESIKKMSGVMNHG